MSLLSLLSLLSLISLLSLSYPRSYARIWHVLKNSLGTLNNLPLDKNAAVSLRAAFDGWKPQPMSTTTARS